MPPVLAAIKEAAPDPVVSPAIHREFPSPGSPAQHPMYESIDRRCSSQPSGERRPLVVCTTRIPDPAWRWFAPVFDRVRWEFFGLMPRNWLERKIRRPALASWRSCWNSIRTAHRQQAALLISHDARVTFRCASAARLQRVRIPHVAWGFNFTTLPRGLQRRLMARALRSVDRFITYSTMERAVYADYFGIEAAKIDVVLWGVGQPLVEPAETPLEQGDYICALGGNARDYRALFTAMASLPEIPLVAVLRPENLAGLEVPPNVRLHFNLPLGNANNILGFSRFMVLPLAGSDVPCGHVTLVAAMLLKKAMIISNSTGVSDYVEEGVSSLLVPVGDSSALASRIRELWNDPARAEQIGAAGYAFASANCSEATVISHLRQVMTEFGLPV
jgi:glycosyltransferase involved in cell wall biosynthesis